MDFFASKGLQSQKKKPLVSFGNKGTIIKPKDYSETRKDLNLNSDEEKDEVHSVLTSSTDDILGSQTYGDDFDNIESFLQQDTAAKIASKDKMRRELSKIDPKLGKAFETTTTTTAAAAASEESKLEKEVEPAETLEPPSAAQPSESSTEAFSKKYGADGFYKKFKKHIPEHSAAEVRSLCKKHVKQCIPELMSGTRTSPFFLKAYEICNASKMSTMSRKLQSRINWTEFSIGYLGSEAQKTIAAEIEKQFGDKFDTMSSTKQFSQTLNFYGKEFFVLHILSPEVAAHVAKLDFGVSLSEAYDILQDTVDYGRLIDKKLDAKLLRLGKKSTSDIADFIDLSDDSDDSEMARPTRQKRQLGGHKVASKRAKTEKKSSPKKGKKFSIHSEDEMESDEELDKYGGALVK